MLNHPFQASGQSPDEDQPEEFSGHSTRSVHAGEIHPKPHHALVDPIFQTSTYTFDSMADVCAFEAAHEHGTPIDRYEYGLSLIHI